MKYRRNALVAALLLASTTSYAAGHREAPGTAMDPKCDTTDFYAFRSWQDPDKIVFIENSDGLQSAYGGPNYFPADTDCIALMHMDINGDGIEDVTFQKTVINNPITDVADITVDGSGQNTPVLTIAQNGPASEAIQFTQSYKIDVIYGPYWTVGPNSTFTNAANFNSQGFSSVIAARDHASITGVAAGDTMLRKPHDNAGENTFPDSMGGYAAYADQFIYDVTLDNNQTLAGRVFYGQRKDAFQIPLGKIFDLLNFDPLAADGSVEDALAENNVTSWVVEMDMSDIVPADAMGRRVVAAWSTRGRIIRQLDSNGEIVEGPEGIIGIAQRSRMGNPLVNELVIGTKDKDRFNQASHPSTDGQFADYVVRPSFPAIVEAVFNVPAPSNIPRTDLVAAFLTGFTLTDQNSGDVLLNTVVGDATAEMLRIDMTVPPTDPGQQNSLGVLGGDLAGYPNGRRPGDDVVDIVTRVAMGALCHVSTEIFGCAPADAPVGNAPLGDGVASSPEVYTQFPFLLSPVAGSLTQ